MTAAELRKNYLEFFESKGHTIVPSASLVPETPGVLFTMAGMFPLVPYLMGQDHPGGKRVANVQKCIRTIDIDEVGDDTHLTFFEMLGNWSFGDYFKKEAIEWSYEFLTDPKWLGLSKDRLAFSVFAGDEDAPRDEESASTWLSLGVPAERIAYLPKENNWWIAGSTGPCGPDTEIFYWIDAGTEPLLPFQEHHEDPRWVEIWNDVFMEFEKQADGSLVPLKQKNVDTGMGLDRVVPILNGQRSVYDVDVFKEMFDVLGLSQEVMTNQEVRNARIILDHVRASMFIVSDGVEPSNKERGYVLRRLLRRSMVYAKLLNLKPHWLEALLGKVAAEYGAAYPELMQDQERIFHVILAEEKKFGRTLEKGLREFEKYIKSGNPFTATDAFNLYQSFGFPWEITRDMAKLAGQAIDEKEFKEEFEKHQNLSRTAQAGEFKGGLVSHDDERVTRLHSTTHLMQSALRKVLGDDVWQKGSNVTAERTRFDFTYPNKLSDEQIAEVEKLVNEWIKRDLLVKQEMVPLEEARKRNAIGLFGEKYADTVSIYTMYDKDTGEVISCEFCGGPHVEHTALINGTFKIEKEEAVSAGIRRVKGIIK